MTRKKCHFFPFTLSSKTCQENPPEANIALMETTEVMQLTFTLKTTNLQFVKTSVIVNSPITTSLTKMIMGSDFSLFKWENMDKNPYFPVFSRTTCK